MLITCPCCHGAKRLTQIEYDEEDGRTIVTKPICCHCQGKGEVLNADLIKFSASSMEAKQ